jgi:predicted 2-oxoglutarate/Fe(II)-dependent dioxygenase YbiX
VIDEFMTPEDADKCLQECIDLKPVYMPASVGAGNQNRKDTTIRKNDVVMLQSVFSAAPERSQILSIMERRMHERDCDQLWHKGDLIFDVINYATWREYVLSRYGRCDFYGPHQDTVRNPDNVGEVTRRLVTVVLYLNTEPEQFTGGELTLFKEAKEITVQPKHNRAVVFPSFTVHKVNNVKLPDDAPFSAGRFSINHWLGFR